MRQEKARGEPRLVLRSSREPISFEADEILSRPGNVSPCIVARSLSIDPVPKGTIYHGPLDPWDALKQKPREE